MIEVTAAGAFLPDPDQSIKQLPPEVMLDGDAPTIPWSPRSTGATMAGVSGSDQADLLFHKGVDAAMAGDLDQVEDVRRRLAPSDPVGALVLEALVSGDDSILDQVANEWMAQAVANDDEGDEALSWLARLVELLPRGTTALAALGFALAGRGHRTEAREIAERLRHIAGDDHVPHFNAAAIFEAAGDLPEAYAEYEHALLAATSPDDRADARIGLGRVAPAADNAAHVMTAGDLAARAEDLGRGIVDLAAFGVDLGQLVEEYLAATDDAAAAATIRGHPSLLAPAAVRAVVAAAGSLLFDQGSSVAQGAANLLADAAEVGLARATRYFDAGAREGALDETDRLEIEGDDDGDVVIARLRLVVNGSTFCDYRRATRAAAEAELGRRLVRRAQQRDDVADLCDAVPLLRRAVSAAPTWSARYWLAVAELGLFRSTGSQVCLERARFLFGDLIANIAADDSDLAPCLYFRGLVGLARSAILGHRGDLEVALLALDHALDLLQGAPTSDGGQDQRDEQDEQRQRTSAVRSQVLDELAGMDEIDATPPALLEHDALVVLDTALEAAAVAQTRGDVAAIDRIRRLLAGSAQAIDWAGAIGALIAWADAEVVLSRHRLAPDPPAVLAATDALEAGRGRVGREAAPYVELTLARLLAERGVDGDDDAAEAATVRLRRLTDIGPTTAGDRAQHVARRAALAQGDAAWRRGDMAEAAAAYDLALSLRSSALAGWAYRVDQLDTLRGFTAAVARAPLAHIRRGDPWAAAVACERTRAVLLSNALPGSVGGDGSSADARATVAAAAELDPLVALIAADDAGYAVLVDRGEASILTLPALTASAVGERAAAIADGAPTPHGLVELTRWLWDAGIGVLADRLAGRRAVNLVPTGPLALLPLHAAWHPDPAQPDGRRHLVDDFVVRYQPNARAFIAATTARPTSARPYATALTVSNPAPSRLPFLTGAEREVQAIRRRLEGTPLDAADATRGAVLGEWGRHDIVHFACHGHATIGAPLRAALFLAGDHPLTAGEILDAEPGGHPLVVLSACETAAGDETIPDEVLTLQSVFLQTGAHGVIGSLWAVDDLATADLMGHFYDALLTDVGDPSAALRAAQQAARGAAAAPADRRRDLGLESRAPTLGATNWMAFTYTGA